jgi:hypothetical protein
MMPDTAAAPRPTIVFGAFDRHNFGDMLFAHVAQALLAPRPLVFAGLVDADLRACGGHRVQALPRIAPGFSGANLVHAGGEILGCDAWLAAAMLLPPQEAQPVLARLEPDAAARLAWARERLGLPDLAPYVAARDWFADAAAIVYNAVGGADFASLDGALRAEVLAKLAAADFIAVRDAQTAAALAASGIASRLLPDPVCLLPELFGQAIAQRARSGIAAQALARFSGAYLAVQFSADFGDDATLARIAAELDRLSAARRLGIVLFRAGAALWHDELALLRRVGERMRMPALVCDSLDIWEICALIAASRGYLGSSLHGRIVAMAFGLPRMNLLARGQQGAKQRAYAATWEAPGLPVAVGIVGVDAIAEGMAAALDSDADLRSRLAAQQAARYRRGFAQLRIAIER